MDIDGIGDADLTAAAPPTGVGWEANVHDPGMAGLFGYGAQPDDGIADVWHTAELDHPDDWAHPVDPVSMVVDTPHGPEDVGPPTEDSGNDGRPDTAVVSTNDGIMLVTDVNGDGTADQITEIDDTGTVTVSHYADHGRWTVVQESRLGQDGPAPDSHAVGTDDSEWIFDEIARSEPGQQSAAQDSDSVWA